MIMKCFGTFFTVNAIYKSV